MKLQKKRNKHNLYSAIVNSPAPSISTHNALLERQLRICSHVSWYPASVVQCFPLLICSFLVFSICSIQSVKDAVVLIKSQSKPYNLATAVSLYAPSVRITSPIFNSGLIPPANPTWINSFTPPAIKSSACVAIPGELA